MTIEQELSALYDIAQILIDSVKDPKLLMSLSFSRINGEDLTTALKDACISYLLRKEKSKEEKLTKEEAVLLNNFKLSYLRRFKEFAGETEVCSPLKADSVIVDEKYRDRWRSINACATIIYYNNFYTGEKESFSTVTGAYVIPDQFECAEDWIKNLLDNNKNLIVGSFVQYKCDSCNLRLVRCCMASYEYVWGENRFTNYLSSETPKLHHCNKLSTATVMSNKEIAILSLRNLIK